MQNARILVGRVAVKEVDFRTFIGSFTRTVEEDEVDDTRHGVGAVNSGSAVLQDFRTGEGADRNGVDVGPTVDAAAEVGAPTIDEDERIARAESAEVDRGGTVTTVGVVFRGDVTDEGGQLTQAFHRGVGALLLQDSGGINRDRQGRFGFRGGDVGTGHDDAIGRGDRAAGGRLLGESAGGEKEGNAEADCESRSERSHLGKHISNH